MSVKENVAEKKICTAKKYLRSTAGQEAIMIRPVIVVSALIDIPRESLWMVPGLEVMAVSEDGLIEAVRDLSQRFLWAVQWHPEFSHKTDESARRIFRAFVEACAFSVLHKRYPPCKGC